MLPVSIRRRPAEAQNDHVRTVPPNHPNHIGEGTLSTPLLHRFRNILRETKVNRTREKLFRAVNPSSRQQFLRPDHAQRRTLFRPNQILPPLAPRQRKIRRPHMPPARKIREDVGPLIVRVCRNHQHRPRFIYLAQRERNVSGRRGLSDQLRNTGYRKCSNKGERRFHKDLPQYIR